MPGQARSDRRPRSGRRRLRVPAVGLLRLRPGAKAAVQHHHQRRGPGQPGRPVHQEAARQPAHRDAVRRPPDRQPAASLPTRPAPNHCDRQHRDQKPLAHPANHRQDLPLGIKIARVLLRQPRGQSPPHLAHQPEPSPATSAWPTPSAVAGRPGGGPVSPRKAAVTFVNRVERMRVYYVLSAFGLLPCLNTLRTPGGKA